ncbi:MAG TPA: hypothetical protein DCP38_12250 [Acidobacteria bacterium]|nr:hypothetical protein [Acidobacteriota bacterium]MDP6374202.1 ribonuclease H-like domain-containing protein [Vicinamibacterales bacterium]HAK56232.1 hypothetical protein [Acidobacteriota bacterium]|tara:strand:- start:12845 stop:14173 length:1329 start_codon:yes stop_codon:yes gene_type:complete
MPDLSRVREILKSARGTRPAPGPIAPPGARVDLDAVAARLGGELGENEAGRYILVRSRYPGERRYGRGSIADAGADLTDGEAFRVLGGLARTPPDDGRALFIDLETTGLSGGAGTVAFLIGVGFFGGGDFHLNQYVLPSLGAERAVLAAVDRLVRSSSALVTFNGKSFDVPVMETRWTMGRMPLPWGELAHVDLLHPARRLWRRRNCRLTALEVDVLGVRRDGDVPGSEIPARYIGYLRRGDPMPLCPVLEHNRLDLVSLAVLTARACRLIAEGPQGDAGAAQQVALGVLYERAGRGSDAAACYRAAAEGPGADGVRAEAMQWLALRSRRAHQHDLAATWWERVLALPAVPDRIGREAAEALAIHHEYRARDLIRASTFARRALQNERDPRRRDAVQHRLARLDRKRRRGGLGLRMDGGAGFEPRDARPDGSRTGWGARRPV